MRFSQSERVRWYSRRAAASMGVLTAPMWAWLQSPRQLLGKTRLRVPQWPLVAAAESRLRLRQSLNSAQLLGETRDGKQILLCHPGPRDPLLREIGRLREISFRAVGEGSGKRRDLDAFDAWYSHIVLWDGVAAEIVGAYRVADTRDVIGQHGFAGLYSHSLFELNPQCGELWQHSLELGRSFVQPRYWGSRSLDYLWQGIGAFLCARPHIRHAFGPVSLSAQLPHPARELIVGYHSAMYPDPLQMGRARAPFVDAARLERLRAHWHGVPLELAPQRLKQELSLHGASLPVLYRQYADLCEPDGVTFSDFSVDPAFANCVDGLVRLDLQRFKPARRERYLNPARGRGRGSAGEVRAVP